MLVMAEVTWQTKHPQPATQKLAGGRAAMGTVNIGDRLKIRFFGLAESPQNNGFTGAEIGATFPASVIRKADKFTPWCNGSTSVSGTDSRGSSPCGVTVRVEGTRIQSQDREKHWFFCGLLLLMVCLFASFRVSQWPPGWPPLPQTLTEQPFQNGRLSSADNAFGRLSQNARSTKQQREMDKFPSTQFLESIADSEKALANASTRPASRSC